MLSTDERARKLLQALQRADLDALIPLLSGLWPRPDNEVYTALRLIFEQARQDHIDLFAPPEDFHAWLLQAAARNHNGGEARANTIRLRLSLLSKLYTALQDEGLLLVHPLRGMPRPPNERLSEPLLSRPELEQLHRQVHADPVLYAALILIDQHAYRVRDLLSLHWEDFDPDTGSALRPHALTRLSDTALAALRPLRSRAGGELYARGRVFPYKQERDLRAALFKACKAANVPYTPPGELRRVSLRDYPHTPQSAGFSARDARKLKQATALAQGLADALRNDPEP
jgi:integrase